MADWKDRFREGSFRDVPFKTEVSKVEGGRRRQDHEFAKRDQGISDDLGRKLKVFTLDLLVIGDDYFQQRDALEDALNAEGPGILIHPYRGAINVQAGGYVLTETVTEGRIARFSVEFSEAGEVLFPVQVIDELSNAKANAEAVKDDSTSFFEDVFDVVGQANFVIESATQTMDEVLTFAEDAVTAVTEPITNFTFAIRNFKASLDDLIRAPDKLAQRLRDTFDLLNAEFENEPETTERIFDGFINVGDIDAFIPSIGDTPSRQREQANQAAILNLVNELSLANRSQATIDVDFISTSAALQSRNAIIAGLNLQLDKANDDKLFQSIKDLQTSLTKIIPRTGETELITISVVKTKPALVIAYEQFEDLDKEAEIIDQNAIFHPGFVPGGDDIQVSAG